MYNLYYRVKKTLFYRKNRVKCKVIPTLPTPEIATPLPLTAIVPMVRRWGYLCRRLNFDGQPKPLLSQGCFRQN